MLVKYVRNRKGHPYGCVVALDPTHVGWSLCHVADHMVDDGYGETFVPGDLFDKKLGIEIASGRARKGWNGGWAVEAAPQSVQRDLLKMKERIARLLEKNITSWVEVL